MLTLQLPRTSECDLIWRRGLYRGDEVRMKPLGWVIIHMVSLEKEEVWTETHRGGRDHERTQGTCHVGTGWVYKPSKTTDSRKTTSSQDMQGRKFPSRFQREHSPAYTLIAAFQPPELWDHTVLLCEPPGLWRLSSSSKLMKTLVFHLETELVGWDSAGQSTEQDKMLPESPSFAQGFSRFDSEGPMCWEKSQVSWESCWSWCPKWFDDLRTQPQITLTRLCEIFSQKKKEKLFFFFNCLILLLMFRRKAQFGDTSLSAPHWG